MDEKITPLSLIDFVFPKKCVGCHSEGQYLCQGCKAKIVLIQKPFCPICHRITPEGQYCPRHRKTFNLTGVIIAAYYESPLKEAIQISKYQKVYTLYEELAEILLQRLVQGLPRGRLILCPMPLHRIKKLSRGFNQAEILTKLLASELEIPILAGLVRTKNTQAQTLLSKNERFNNVKDAFQFHGDPIKIKEKTILLIDDVVTTGATLSAAAAPLQLAGARNVWGVVLAKH